MARTIWNKTTQTYTVSSADRIVRNIPVKTQAVAVAMDLRHSWPASFGDEEAKAA